MKKRSWIRISTEVSKNFEKWTLLLSFAIYWREFVFLDMRMKTDFSIFSFTVCAKFPGWFQTQDVTPFVLTQASEKGTWCHYFGNSSEFSYLENSSYTLEYKFSSVSLNSSKISISSLLFIPSLIRWLTQWKWCCCRSYPQRSPVNGAWLPYNKHWSPHVFLAEWCWAVHFGGKLVTELVAERSVPHFSEIFQKFSQIPSRGWLPPLWLLLLWELWAPFLHTSMCFCFSVAWQDLESAECRNRELFASSAAIKCGRLGNLLIWLWDKSEIL